MKAIYQAYERNAALVLASENWAKGYDKAPIQHGKLIKANAKLQRKILLFFKDIAKNRDDYIDWFAYRSALHEVKATRVNAWDVSVIVKDDPLAATDDVLVNILFDELATSTFAGFQAGEVVYDKLLGGNISDSDIQQLVWAQVANLVGKRLTQDGNLIDNPNADYRISDKTRDDIRESIRTSLNLGEDVQDASSRLDDSIKSFGQARSQTIANTESVNAYNQGLHQFGKQSGATGKEWIDNQATDECADNADDGIIDFGDTFSSGDSEPAAHPNCRCYIRLVYQNETDNG